MHRTLFYIPHEFAGIPIFGFGWALGALAAYAIVTTLLARRDSSEENSQGSNLATLGFGAVLIAFVFPGVEIRNLAGEPIGMAVRGYGVMLVLAVSAGLALAVYRARRKGIGPDTILSVLPWMFVLAILGARTFYVIEYFDSFNIGNPVQMFVAIIDFTRGGIVVYGAIIGGSLGLYLFCHRNKLSFFKLADVIIPCLFVGLCLGRIGCLLNGCCHGGLCEPSSQALYFPKGSPVYEVQLRDGSLIGLDVDWPKQSDDEERIGTISAVRPDSLAAKVGIEAGSEVRTAIMSPTESEIDHSLARDDTSQLGVTAIVDGRRFYWPHKALPETALPVTPTQIYSSLAGFVVAIFLVLISPRITRDGVLMGIGFGTYAIVRFGLEAVRTDEPGQFGTGLTISQLVSIAILTASVILIITLLKRTPDPRGNAMGVATD